MLNHEKQEMNKLKQKTSLILSLLYEVVTEKANEIKKTSDVIHNIENSQSFTLDFTTGKVEKVNHHRSTK